MTSLWIKIGIFPAIVVIAFLACYSAIPNCKEEHKKEKQTQLHQVLSDYFVAIPAKADSNDDKKKAEDSKPIGKCSGFCSFVIKAIDDPVAFFTLILSFVVWLQFIWMTRQEEVLSKSVDAAKQQARVALMSSMPVVGWADQKLIAYAMQGGTNVIVDNPAPYGLPPAICRPEFAIKNAGPTKIIVSRYAIKCQISPQLSPDPIYDKMSQTALVIDAGQALWFATPDLTAIDAPQLVNIKNGKTHLWFYGFITYNDFLEESHEIGFCFRWSVDPAIGFVNDGPEKYSYTKHQKQYT